MGKRWIHVLFVAVCAAVLIVLLRAPEITTPRLPADTDHADRKAYTNCPSCHGADSANPMTADHGTESTELRPDHVKCYFCHKPRD